MKHENNQHHKKLSDFFSKDEIDMKHNYSVPENYFDEFPLRMLRKAKEKEAKRGRRNYLKGLFSFKNMVVVGLELTMICIASLVLINQQLVEKSTVSEVAASDFETHIVDQMDEYVIVDYLMTNDDIVWDESSTDMQIVDDASAAQYLQNENIEELIIEEY